MLYILNCVHDFAYVQKQLVHATHKLPTAKHRSRHRRAHTHTHDRRHTATTMVWMRNARTIMNMNVVHVRAGRCLCIWHVACLCRLHYMYYIHVALHASGKKQQSNNRIKMKEDTEKYKIVKQRNETMHASRLLRVFGVRLLHTDTHTHFGAKEICDRFHFIVLFRAQVNEMCTTVADRRYSAITQSKRYF